MKQFALTKWFNNISITKKLYFVLGIMGLLIAIELFALWFSINTLSSIRAYVGGEGLWSKAEKDAIYHLSRYANQGEKKDYKAFLDFMKVPLGDKKARIELEKENPDFTIARQGFLEGLNNPDDIDGMIKIFRRFRNIYYIDKAIGIWTEADPIIAKLIPIGERLDKEISSASPSREKIDQILLEITPINDKLTQLENDFSYTLGEGSRWLENLIMKVLVCIILLIEIAGLVLTITVGRRISIGITEVMRVAKEVAKGNFLDKAAIYSKDEIGVLAGSFNAMTYDLEKYIKKLRIADRKIIESEESYRQLFENTTDLIQGVSPNGTIQFVNKAWREKLGYSIDEINNGISILKIIPQENQEKCMQIFQQVITDGMSQNIETEIAAKDGKKITIEGNINCKFVDGSPQLIQCFLRDVTEQKRASHYARSLIEASLDPLVTVCAKGFIMYVNEATVKVTGISRENLIGTDFSKYFTEPEKVKEGYRVVLEKGFIADYELTVKHKNGKLTDFLCNASIYKDDKGNVIGLFAAARDITERKKNDEVLKSKTNQLSDAQQLAHIGSWEWDVLANKIEWSDELYRIYGLSPHEFEANYENYLKYVHPDDRGYVNDTIQAALKDHQPYHFFHRVVHPNGTVRVVSSTGKVFIDSNNNAVKMAGTAQDVTEQKQASQYARSLIEASLDPLVTISAEGKITDVNEASVKITGVAREHLIGTDFSHYFTEPDKAQDGYQQVFDKSFVADYPLTIRHTSGKLTDVLYNASVYKDDNGKVLGIFAAARDITAQKEREKELAKIQELERFREITVGRELKMLELKKEIEELKNKILSLES